MGGWIAASALTMLASFGTMATTSASIRMCSEASA